MNSLRVGLSGTDMEPPGIEEQEHLRTVVVVLCRKAQPKLKDTQHAGHSVQTASLRNSGRAEGGPYKSVDYFATAEKWMRNA